MIDASTDDNLEQSLDRVRASLPESRRPTFDASLSTISTILRASSTSGLLMWGRLHASRIEASLEWQDGR